MNTPFEFDSLWDYNNPNVSEEHFRQLLPQITADSAEAAEVMTQIARAQGLQKHFEEAYVTLDEVERSLHDQWHPRWIRARIRYFLERGRVYNSSGHVDAARSMFFAAWELASKTMGEDVLAIDAAHMMGIVEPTDKQILWNLQALSVAENSENEKAKRWKASLYNNIGWSYHEKGEYELALQHFQKALLERQMQQQVSETRIAKWCVGRALRSLERIDDALVLQQQLAQEMETDGTPDGFVYEEIAECLLMQNKADEAVHYFALAHNHLSKATWFVQQEPDRLERLLTLSKRKGI